MAGINKDQLMKFFIVGVALIAASTAAPVVANIPLLTGVVDFLAGLAPFGAVVVIISAVLLLMRK